MKKEFRTRRWRANPSTGASEATGGKVLEYMVASSDTKTISKWTERVAVVLELLVNYLETINYKVSRSLIRLCRVLSVSITTDEGLPVLLTTMTIQNS
jgi:hypothetical protein